MLSKVPKGKDINDGDKFSYNKDFTNALFKIKINQVSQYEITEWFVFSVLRSS